MIKVNKHSHFFSLGFSLCFPQCSSLDEETKSLKTLRKTHHEAKKYIATVSTPTGDTWGHAQSFA